jgi:hypothetical protein
MITIDLRKLYDLFSVIPLKGKAPISKGWTQYSEKKINYSKISNHRDNFGIVCGYDGLEVVDIDNHFNDADKLFAFISDNIDIGKYLIIKTGGGGYHIYYKCDVIAGNQKLAQRINEKGKAEVLIETRGQGGQVVFYNNIVNGSIDNVPVIDNEERTILLQICKSLNEVEKKPNISKDIAGSEGAKPGEKYNADPFSIQETISLLKQHGWTSRDDIYFIRPGKTHKDGISATFGKVGKNKFYVFSSNADPFEMDTSYSMFGVRTELMFRGDYSACAKELSKKYGIIPKQKKESKSKPKQTKSNDKWQVLEDIIEEWNLKFRYNVITKVLDVSANNKEYEPLQLLPGDIIREMEVNRGIRSISTNKLMEMISNQSICTMYNPVESFFESLPKWNKEDNIKKLCDYIELDRDENRNFFESMFKKHMIRTVKCAKIPDYINRMVLVYHGPQEIGKTMLFRWMTPRELYNEESINPTEKDSVLALGRYLVINMDELDSLSKKDVSKLKAFISRGEIIKRVAYGRHDERFNRIASFVGSTNKSGILADTTNTRWIILKVKKFDWQNYIKNVEPLQIWAQALAMLKEDTYAGELSLSEKQERERRNSIEFLETSAEREILLKHFTESNDSKGLTATEIKHLIEVNLHPLKINLYQLVRELHRLYGEPKHDRRDKKQGRYFRLIHNLNKQSEQNYVDFYDTERNEENVPF